MKDTDLNFTELLKCTLEEKCKANPRYSLRSFAKSVNISAASLSGIINGKRKPSVKMIEKVGVALGMSSQDILQSQKEMLELQLVETKQQFVSLEKDTFSLIADWYHLAILELIKLNDFQANEAWVAKRLQLNVNQIKMAVGRLKRLGIIEVTSNGRWIDKTNGFNTHYKKNNTSEAKRFYQSQILDKSKESLIQDSIEMRDHSSMVMAIDPKDMSRAKDEIGRFRKKLSKLLESTKNKKEVYQLQMALFPITRAMHKKKVGLKLKK